MSDLIDRQAAIDALTEYGNGRAVFISVGEAVIRIENLPPAEPKRGRWIYHIDDLFPAESTMECNQCHAEKPLTCDDEFCPHCGAKMEKKE